MSTREEANAIDELVRTSDSLRAANQKLTDQRDAYRAALERLESAASKVVQLSNRSTQDWRECHEALAAARKILGGDSDD